jgi:hypothetical protein
MVGPLVSGLGECFSGLGVIPELECLIDRPPGRAVVDERALELVAEHEQPAIALHERSLADDCHEPASSRPRRRSA